MLSFKTLQPEADQKSRIAISSNTAGRYISAVFYTVAYQFCVLFLVILVHRCAKILGDQTIC
jgi:hypothetical protein